MPIIALEDVLPIDSSSSRRLGSIRGSIPLPTSQARPTIPLNCSLPNGYYIVQEVVDHGLDEPTGLMKFLCHWEGYDELSDYTWEYESNLINCYTPVQNYCQQHGLTTNIRPVGGADPTSKHHNPSLWVPLEDVVTQITQHLSMSAYKDSGLSILPIDSALAKAPLIHHGSADSLFIVLHCSHFYTLLYSSSTGTAVGADGINNIREDPETHQVLSKLLGCPISAMETVKRHGQDHCGAHAASLALELIRRFKQQDNSMRLLEPPKQVAAKMVARMYKGPSKPLTGRVPINERAKTTCKHCSTFSRFSKKEVLLHERACAKKNK